MTDIASASKQNRKRWLADVDDADFATDQAIERLLKRDGRKVYEAASGELLTFFANSILYLDGEPQ
jgi:hypothetical protein